MAKKDAIYKEGKGAKRCDTCGAKTWMFDDMQQQWKGPWHFRDCAVLPGNDELLIRDTEEQMRYAEEKIVPKEMGANILKAIYTMLDSSSHDIMMQRKAAILGEIARL